MNSKDKYISAVETAQVNSESRIVFRIMVTLMVLAVIYLLAVAQKIFIPVVLALLLSFVFSPIMRWLSWIRIPRVLAAGVIVLLVLCGMGIGVSGSVEPISGWFNEAPQMLDRLERKIYPIKKTVEEVGETADQVDHLASIGKKQIIEVQDGISFRDMLYANAQGIISGTLLTLLLLYFFLSWGRVMLVRAVRQLGKPGRSHRFLKLAIVLENDVSKYLLSITLINFCLGIVVAMLLYAFGLPHPVLWGAMAAILNYIPYLGSFMMAMLLGVAALLAFDNLTSPMLIVVTFSGLTIIEGQIITPLVLGKRLALNPLVVFLSVVFWFWLWGVIGALMAVPILISLKIVSGHVEVMRPFSVIAGR